MYEIIFFYLLFILCGLFHYNRTYTFKDKMFKRSSFIYSYMYVCVDEGWMDTFTNSFKRIYISGGSKKNPQKRK